jgi:allantoinase
VTSRYNRDLIGYGPNPPDPKWANDARLAVNFVMNYEEGSEPSVQDGEGFSETGLTEAHGLNQVGQGRDLAAETMFEYGSRVGFWRLVCVFQERRLPLTIFGCALAMARAACRSSSSESRRDGDALAPRAGCRRSA